MGVVFVALCRVLQAVRGMGSRATGWPVLSATHNVNGPHAEIKVSRVGAEAGVTLCLLELEPWLSATTTGEHDIDPFKRTKQ